MSRRVAREVALKTIFQLDFGGDREQAFLNMLEEEPLEQRDQEFAKNLIDGVTSRQGQIDDIIRDFAVDWKLERVARVERTILRMALYELLWVEDIPPNVTVNEAVELAKVYSSPEAGRFVNGILGNVLNHLRALKNQLREGQVHE